MQVYRDTCFFKHSLMMALASALLMTGCDATLLSPEGAPEDEAVEVSGIARRMQEGDDLCDAPDFTSEEFAKLEDEYQQLRVLRAARANGSVTVPVYFHVIRQGLESYNGEVTLKQVYDQMAVLNTAFANTPYRFDLVWLDRTTNPSWFRLLKGTGNEATMKHTLKKGGPGSLNIYTMAPQDGSLGWSSYPWELSARPTMDGVVVSYASLPGGAEAPFNRGATLVHMVGHWFGVLHTYEAGCTGSDGVADTAAEASPAFGCPVNRDSCPGGGTDPIRNYMDSTDDSCKTGFTPGQSARMDAIGAAYRL
ncbi:zinc metalloprotease [Hyalangium gracile]|uniref:zinc metalloprotease n=1 Tax=Hyalangium gracile TaxID=394092 RepID=UPI001CCD075E|nr:zinc metalloprotease [Hyalangium gracile]